MLHTLLTLSPSARVVALPCVHWTDGTVLDLAVISAYCREQSIVVVVDGTQSIGAQPFSIDQVTRCCFIDYAGRWHEDVSQVQPDFLVCAGYKWLLCPYGLAFLYVSPQWQVCNRPAQCLQNVVGVKRQQIFSRQLADSQWAVTERR